MRKIGTADGRRWECGWPRLNVWVPQAQEILDRMLSMMTVGGSDTRLGEGLLCHKEVQSSVGVACDKGLRISKTSCA
jgi:hypothetical protein